MLPLLSRARMRAPVVAITVAALCCALGTADALAAKAGKPTGGGTGSGSGGLSLVSEYIQNSPNPSAPTDCLNEDDYHKRNWTGSLNGTFTATEQLCGSGSDWWTAGGIGLRGDLWTSGTLNDVTITSPAGDSHHAVFVESSTSKGVTLNHYQVCYVPQFSLQYDNGGTPLPGGTWQISLAGNLSKVNYSVTAQMSSVQVQQTYCPVSEQNLI
jgi:hypothetical protein